MHSSTSGRGRSGPSNTLNVGDAGQRSSQSRSPSGNFAPGDMSGASVADPTAGDANWYYAGTRGAASQENKISAGSPPSPAMIGPTSTFYNPDEVSFLQREEQLRQWSEAFTSTALPQATPQITYNPAFGQDQALQGMFTFVSPHFHNTNMSSFGNTELYGLYPDMMTLDQSGSATPNHSAGFPTPETLHSFTNTPEPTSQPLPSHPVQPTLRTQQPQPSYPIHTGQLQQDASQLFVPQPPQGDQRKQGSGRNDAVNASPPFPSVNVWNQGPTRPTGQKPRASATKAQSTSQASNARSTQQAKRAPPRTSPAPFIPPPPSGTTSVFVAEKPNASAPVKTSTSTKRKRPKKDEEDLPPLDSQSGESEDDGIRTGFGGFGMAPRRLKRDKGNRPPGACSHCKKLKMRCEFPGKDADTCKRCTNAGHACFVEGRRQRTAPNKREYLLAQIRQKDTIIETLLKQIHNPYTATPMSVASYRMATSPSDQKNTNVMTWLERLQASARDTPRKPDPTIFLNLRKMDTEEDSDEADMEAKIGEGDAKEDANTLSDTDGSSQEEKIQSSLPGPHVPLGLIAGLSLDNSKAERKKFLRKDLHLTEDDLNEDNIGVANGAYFMPGPATNLKIRKDLIEQHSPPDILLYGIVQPEDIEKLFKIFYDRINPFISLLDPVLHTSSMVFARCPFLFTVVCAISSRYYTEKSEIYAIAMHFAKHAAANALIEGWKSVELCQAYILMSIYAVPARRWEEDRSWLYTGLAIRIATDLNLHQASTVKPTSERQEREILNRTRVWMICFNLDRSTATQFGKPSTIKEDFIVRGALDWYKKSQYNHPYDIHLCAYAALLQIVSKFHDEIFSDPSSPSGLNKKVDFKAVTLAHDEQLTRFHHEWSQLFETDSPSNDPACLFRCSLLPFLVSYSRLVMFSFGFQQAFQRGFESGDSVFFTTCLEAAKSVIEHMLNGLVPSGYMKFAPDGHFIFAAFASAFLLKLLRPELQSFLSKEQETQIFDLIGKLIYTLSSTKIAIDERHTPKLYARFLAGLLSRHRRDGAIVGRLQTNLPPSEGSAGGGHNGANLGSFSVTSVGQQLASGSGQSSMGTFNPGMMQTMSTPTYKPELQYTTGAGAISFAEDFDMTYGVSIPSDDELLAPMQALKNPAYWTTMMMPGFFWSDPSSTNSPPHILTSPGPIPHNMVPQMDGLQSGFNIFHTAQAMM